jgi:branched-chain amino acid transport system substrate-binding protein
VPADDVQASAAAGWTRRLGAARVYVLGDKSVEGDGRALQYRLAAGRAGLNVVGDDRMDPRAKEYRDLAEDIRAKAPDAVYFGGAAESNAVQLWRDLHAALPKARLVGSHELLVPQFYSSIGAAAPRTYLTSVAQDPSRLPPAGRRFVRDYRREFGAEPDPFAAYGHAAMALLLDALRRAGDRGNQRSELVGQVLSTSDFDSAVGRFSIDPHGDTSLRRMSGYGVRDGRPVLLAALEGDREPQKGG